MINTRSTYFVMGHIKLAVPVAHIWFAYGVPNRMSIILNMSHKKLLSVIYYNLTI